MNLDDQEKVFELANGRTIPKLDDLIVDPAGCTNLENMSGCSFTLRKY